jgi:hypothetical protein
LLPDLHDETALLMFPRILFVSFLAEALLVCYLA